ncbi:hypothetical protein [Niveibacterium sp. SC-1]|uniref:hypothetical protein n=1 Tax=Niveibacterium sp. SC-1 TaxID=3135646 RepID=UPI00311EB86A
MNTPLTLGQGTRLGNALYFIRGLERQTCLLKSRAWIGLVRVERVVADLRYATVSLLPQESAVFPIRSPELLTLRGPSTSLHYCAVKAGFSSGLAMDCLVHDHRIIKALTDLASTGVSTQQFIRALNRGTGLPEDVQELFYQEAPRSRPENRGGRPALAWSHWDGRWAVQLSDLPPPCPPLVAWIDEYPTAPLQAAAHSATDGPAQAMQHLLHCDRAHRQRQPDARAAVEESADLLFAHKPEFAMFYAMYCEGVYAAADMGLSDWLRLLGELASHAGWDFGELALEPLEEGVSEHTIAGPTYSVERNRPTAPGVPVTSIRLERPVSDEDWHINL